MQIIINIKDLPVGERGKIESLKNFCNAFHSVFKYDKTKGEIAIDTPSSGKNYAYEARSVHLQSVLLFPQKVTPYHLPYSIQLELPGVQSDDFRLTDTANYIRKDMEGKFHLHKGSIIKIDIKLPYLYPDLDKVISKISYYEPSERDLERLRLVKEYLRNTFPELAENSLAGKYDRPEDMH